MPTLLPLGRLLVTPGALRILRGLAPDGADVATALGPLLARHAAGDWGDVDAEDWQANDRAVCEGARILSAFQLTTGDGAPCRLWMVTEADRSATTVLLPDEY